MVVKYFKYMLLILLLSIVSLSTMATERDNDSSLGIKRGSQLSKVNFLLFNHDMTKYRVLNQNDSVTSGQKFIIKVNTIKKSYLYILSKDSSNNLNILFPRKEIAHANPLNQDTNYYLPSNTLDKTLVYQFDNSSRNEKIYIYKSHKPIAQLDKIVKKYPLGTLKLIKNKPIKKFLNKRSQNLSRYIININKDIE